MYTLFAWLIVRDVPPTTTGSNGEPVATTARPSLHVKMSLGVASAHEVGLESGQISGAAAADAIARIAGSVNAPA